MINLGREAGLGQSNLWVLISDSVRTDVPRCLYWIIVPDLLKLKGISPTGLPDIPLIFVI